MEMSVELRLLGKSKWSNEILPLNIARFATYFILLILALIEKNFSGNAGILIFLLSIISCLDIIKDKNEDNHQLFVTLNFLNYFLAFIFGFYSYVTLSIILYCIFLVDYILTLKGNHISWPIFLTFTFAGVFFYLQNFSWLNILSEMLVAITLVIFAIVMGNLVNKQKDEKEKIQALQIQLIQKEKMASLGHLTSGIVHEINTPLGVIKSNTELIEMLVDSLYKNYTSVEGDKIIKILEKIKKVNHSNRIAGERLIDTIKKLKTFSRLDEADWQQVDIHDGIETVLDLTFREYKNRIKLIKNYGNIPRVYCNPALINQVLMNVILNAFQAIDSTGEIFINTYSDDKYIYVKIRDTGKGIPLQYQSKIFDPGFTTKGSRIGMGLGLTLSYNIVKEHNGDISFISEPYKGTEFIIKIPTGGVVSERDNNSWQQEIEIRKTGT